MYDRSDPRSQLGKTGAAAAPHPEQFAGPQSGHFYAETPQQDDANGRTWFLRGANFVIAHSEAKAGARFARSAQADEYAILIMTRGMRIRVTAGAEACEVTGPSLVFVPPGPSAVEVIDAGPIDRLFSAQSADLVALCPNAQAYDNGRANIPPFKPWPAPPSGWRIRSYGLDIAPKPGRFGRIFRCTTLMVNVLEAQMGPRDITKLSPHHHDDFEQLSLALEGSFMHHLRWPWTVNLNAWREDEHLSFKSPSALVIPPPSIHTSRGMEPGCNQLIDIFSPPRFDFSQQAGWVLNADEYPMPPADA